MLTLRLRSRFQQRRAHGGPLPQLECVKRVKRVESRRSSMCPARHPGIMVSICCWSVSSSTQPRGPTSCHSHRAHNNRTESPEAPTPPGPCPHQHIHEDLPQLTTAANNPDRLLIIKKRAPIHSTKAPKRPRVTRSAHQGQQNPTSHMDKKGSTATNLLHENHPLS